MAKYLVNAAVTIEVEAASEHEAANIVSTAKGVAVRVETIRPTSVNGPEPDFEYYEVAGRCEGCSKILMEGDGYYYDANGVTVCSRCVARQESEAE